MTKKTQRPRANPLFAQAFKARTTMLREGAGLSQGEVASIMGVATNTYQKYESRKGSMLPPYRVKAFLDAINGTPEDCYYLFTGLRRKQERPRTKTEKVRA